MNGQIDCLLSDFCWESYSREVMFAAKECECSWRYVQFIWYNANSKHRKVKHPLIYQTKSGKVTLNNRKIVSRNSKAFEQLCKEAKKKSK